MTSLGLHIVKHRPRNSMKEVQTLPGADTLSVHNLLVAKKVKKGKTKMRSGEVLYSTT